MHRFPYRPSFRIDTRNCIQDFCRTAFPLFADIENFLFATYLLAHGVRFNDHTTEPEIRFTICSIIWVHMYRKFLQSIFISFINCFLLCNMLFQIRELSSHYACDHIAHAVIVSQFLMLIPRSIFSGLRRPFPYFLCRFFIIGKKHSAG